MSRQSQFTSLIPLIYDAPFTDAGWQTVMDNLTSVFDSQWTQMHAANAIDKGIDFSAIHPLDENTGRAYLEHYINIDPRAPFLVKRDNIVRIRKDIVSDDVFYKSEIYNDFLKPNEAEQTLLTPIEGLSAGVNFIVLMRGDKQGSYTVDDAKDFEVLAPHFQRAFFIQNRLAKNGILFSENASLFDKLQIGVVVVDTNDVPIHINATADGLLKSNDGLGLTKYGRLVAQQTSENARLETALLNIHQIACGESTYADRVFHITREPPKPRLQVLITPAPKRFSLCLSPQPKAVVFISDPSRRVTPPIDAIMHLHGLTRTEAKLAIEISNGSTLEEYSESQHVSIHTARTQVKSIMGKCGVKRQTQLVRVILRDLVSLLPLDD